MRYQAIFLELKEELDQFSHGPAVIAVSKYVDAEEVKLAYDAGFRDFGENRVPDLIEKARLLSDSCPDIRWHFIGNIQSKKIKELMGLRKLYAIHSVDNLKHLRMIGERAVEPVKIFIQVNTSGEHQKGGVHSIDEVDLLIKEISHFPYLFFEGLMCMASLGSSLDQAEHSFIKLADIAKKVSTAVPIKLSMGMSGDYPRALKHGAHFVRIGSKIFK